MFSDGFFGIEDSVSWWIPGLLAAITGKAIGAELFHRRQQKKRLAASVIIESEGGAEHSAQTGSLPKLICGPVEDGVGTRSH